MQIKLVLPETTAEQREKIASDIEIYISGNGTLHKVKSYIESTTPDRSDAFIPITLIVDQLEVLQKSLKQ